MEMIRHRVTTNAKAMTVACPFCRAKAGAKCASIGVQLRDTHRERQWLSVRVK